MPGPLNGIRVLDLSRFIAGPQCAMVLGDLGADVVKVERKEFGDDVRAIHPQIDGESIYFMMFNRNKRGMTLDFRNPAGQALLRDMVRQADVLVENFRPGTMEKMGCGWETLHALNPRLIMARVSGYGQGNSRSEEPCLDGIAQARSGLMELTGEPGGKPTMFGSFIVDYTTALYTAIGILSAIERRHTSGVGQVVDVSLMGGACSLLLTAITEAKTLGRHVTRGGNRDRYSAPGQTFQCRDGRWVHLIAGTAAMFPRLAAVLEKPELLEDPRFATHAARMENQDGVEAIVAAWIAGIDADQAVAMLAAADVPAAKVATINEVVNEAYMQEAEHIVAVPHARIGPIAMQGLPIRLGESPASIRAGAPCLGADTAAVLLDWLGLDSTAIAGLSAVSAV